MVDNDGLHGVYEKSSQIALKKGLHPITVDFFEHGGGEKLEVFYKGTGIQKQVISAGVLFHKP